MASSSAASPNNTKKRKYDVFLSFRGEDTRQNFTCHLNSALRRKSIETFIDDELGRGKEITPGLEKAIEGCMIAVVIFSENYASSSFCLDEVAKIIQCHETHGEIVLPIFYHIDPSNVENQTGSFGIAFSKHYQIYDFDRVRKWKSALSRAANMAGWDSQVTRPESKLVDSIVEDVLEKLKHAFSCDTLEGFVGLNSRINYIIDILSNVSSSHGVFILGIWGQGGIGKTTLAEAVFHRIKRQFEGRCFLENVRERSEKHDGLTSLVEKLLSKTLKEKDLEIPTPSMGYSFYVRRMLSRRSVLIVLDDVNNSNQLDSLVGCRKWFGAGSRIIVTSRDRQVLNTFVDYVHEVRKFRNHEALKLFNLNAFKKTSPTESYRFLSQSVVKYADGIPLALKVLGSSLCGKNEREWESALDKLKKTPDKDIQRVLRVSYDNLDHYVKDAFLHLACFFKGMISGEVESILDCCGFSRNSIFGVLRDKCLMDSSRFRIEMHDLLEEMGKEIVREECRNQPGKRSRLWDPEDIIGVLRKNAGTESIEAIFFNMTKMTTIDDEIIEIDLNPNVFARMSNLKLLSFYTFHPRKAYGHPFYLTYKVSLSQGLTFLSNELRYFEWIGYPAKTLPANFLPVDLVELRLPYSKLERLPSKFFENFHKLKMIDLSGSTHLIGIPELKRATSLTSIILSECRSLGCFPSCIHLKSLERLNLSYCPKLNRFPEVSSHISFLDISETAIEEVSPSVECLVKLRHFRMENCKKIENLPQGVCKLKSLVTLSLSGCSNLKKFPEILEPMNLLSLYLDGTAIEELPSSIENLKILPYLDLHNCQNLVRLPECLFNSKFFESLNLSDCPKLVTCETHCKWE